MIIDAGASSWCCGYHESEGPDVTMPGVRFTDHAAWASQLAAAFEQLEVDPSEVSVLLSEPPGVSAADREHAAKTLFHEHRVLALSIAASPIQALYHFDKTALVVDCAGDGASVYAVYDGFALLEGAAIAPLTDLADAILRTVALVDTSLRGALLSQVALTLTLSITLILTRTRTRSRTCRRCSSWERLRGRRAWPRIFSMRSRRRSRRHRGSRASSPRASARSCAGSEARPSARCRRRRR